MVRIAKRFLPFFAICGLLRTMQMAISNSRLIKHKAPKIELITTQELSGGASRRHSILGLNT